MIKRVGIIIVVLALIVGGYFTYQKLTRVEPEVLIQKAVQNTIASDNYRYEAQSRILNGTKVQFLSNIQGEKGGGSNMHVKGRVLDVDMEVFRIGKTAYNKDPFSHRWYVLENQTVFKDQLYMTEADPLANFNFSKVTGAYYRPAATIGGHKCLVVSLVPEIENQYLALTWKDFKYTMWIDKKERVIRKGSIKAVSKSNPQFSLVISAEFKDFDQEITITPPRI